MHRWRLYGLYIILLSASSCMGHAQEIILTNNNTSNYKIAVPADATKLEQRSAEVLQRYIHTISGAQLPIVTDTKAGSPSIFIGHTFKADRLEPGKMKPESYLLATTGKDIVICGGSGKGLIYGVYRLLERYMGCKKLCNGDAAIVPSIKQIKLPGIIHEEYHPPFEYRESYYPASNDAEYLEWNQLHKLDDLWGVWGHSYNKLVPAKTYFTEHPEYYALVKGKRQPSQLCLSNDNVFKIIVAELKKRMAQNPDAIYWSISPNDDNGYCECDKCRATDNEQGSHAGSLIKFVNRVAAVFPDKKFTTLAYGYTHKAPASLKPSDNVYVFLSDIDAYRDKPLEQEPTAAPFRADLKAWRTLTGNIFVWDYVTEFTNYLAPFPNFNTLQPNMLYLKNNGVKGIFAQGSGDTYGEWAELRSYVLAKLFEDPEANAQTIISSYLKDYYGPAASYLQEYLDLLQQQMVTSKRKLDIYGDPVNEWKTYLSPELLDRYSTLFDKAEGAVADNPTLSERVMRARLPLEYTVLQQARFYGIEQHGIFVQSDGRWSVKPKFDEKVSQFTSNCKKAGVTELSEGGDNPDQYQTEWSAIFKNGVTPSKAVGANVTLQYAFSDDYPAKGPHTLTDGNPGYSDYSYNWLCFYGVPMIATIDLGKTQKISGVRMHFLDDPRHRIFLPANILVETSADGINYHKAGNTNSANTDEHYETTVKEFSFPASTTARYIRVTANDLPTLPDWRAADNKKPMIACDEIYVQ